MIQSQLLNQWRGLHPHINGGLHVCWPPGVVRHDSWAGYFRDEMLFLMLGGRGRMGLREGWVDWAPGTLFWLSPGFQYTLEQNPGEPSESISLHFTLVDGKGQETDSYIRGPEDLTHAGSAAEFVKLHRMRYARRLLVESDRNISEVAELCGFADVATFSKAFKKAIGTLPSQYCRNHPVFTKDQFVRF